MDDENKQEPPPHLPITASEDRNFFFIVNCFYRRSLLRDNEILSSFNGYGGMCVLF
jgi:hypothetical protein